MLICEIIMLVLIGLTCIISSYTDIRYNTIHNKLLLTVTICGSILIAVYYIFFASIYFIDFAVNSILVILFSLLLYVLHIWAGGDTKLLIVILSLIPARWYISINEYCYTVLIVVFVSFFLGYLYLIMDSLVTGLKKKQVIKKNEFHSKMKSFIKRYCISANYLLSFCIIDSLVISDYFELNIFVYIIIGFCIVAAISHFPILMKLSVCLPFFIFNILLLLVLRINPNVISYLGYIFVLIFQAVRIFIAKYSYEEINTVDISSGMILSTASSLIINMNQFEGLPGISKEDQRNKLTVDEAKAVVAWGKSRFGIKTVTVVRKIPFAIFLSLGTLIYIILGGYYLWF